MEKALNEIIASGFIGGILVLFFKVLYDHYVSGRTEKGVYMLIAECEKRQIACGLPFLKKELQAYSIQCEGYKATTDTRLREIDKQLDSGRADFDKIMEDISQIKQSLAGMPTASEYNKIQEDISKIFQSVARIQAVVEFALEHKERNHE